MPTLGGNELIIVLVIVLVLFGGAKIPQLMRGLGQGMKEFKQATRDDDTTNTTTSTNDTTNRTSL